MGNSYRSQLQTSYSSSRTPEHVLGRGLVVLILRSSRVELGTVWIYAMSKWELCSPWYSNRYHMWTVKSNLTSRLTTLLVSQVAYQKPNAHQMYQNIYLQIIFLFLLPNSNIMLFLFSNCIVKGGSNSLLTEKDWKAGSQRRRN